MLYKNIRTTIKHRCTRLLLSIYLSRCCSDNDYSRSVQPPLLLTSDDFNQPSVPVTGSSVPGTVPSVTNPEVSRISQQEEETDLLSDYPQTVTGIMKSTTETDSLVFFLTTIVLM